MWVAPEEEAGPLADNFMCLNDRLIVINGELSDQLSMNENSEEQSRTERNSEGGYRADKKMRNKSC